LAGVNVLLGRPTQISRILQRAEHLRTRMAVGFFFGNTELSLELWNVIAGISGFGDY